jgi:hypothetical protein
MARADGDSDASFARFWSHYPRRTAKAAALAAWAKLVKAGVVCDEWLARIVSAIHAQERARAGRVARGERLADWPHPATWLNGARWEDEVAGASPTRMTERQALSCAAGCGRTADVVVQGAGWCSWHWTERVNPSAISRLERKLGEMGLAPTRTMAPELHAELCREYLLERRPRVAGVDVGGLASGSSPAGVCGP